MLGDIKKTTDSKMQKTIEVLKNTLLKVRTGRAHTGILDQVQVDYYGTMTAINQLSNITLADARTIAVMPWEKKLTGAIEKAIRDSDLGLNPSTNGDTIRVPMPMLTEERRKDLIKVVRAETEDARVSVRNIRREANNQLKEALKEKMITEDDERRGQEDVQKLTDKTIAEIDKILQAKEVELLAV